MNFLDAELEKTENNYKVVMGNFHTEVSLEHLEALKRNNVESCRIILGIRPESLQMTDSPVSFEAEIGVMEMMGSSIHLHLNHSGKQAIMVTQALGPSGKLKMDYKSGSKMNFRFNPEAMYLFDAQSGKSLVYQEE